MGIPKEKLMHGIKDAVVFLNPQHHASLGIVDPNVDTQRQLHSARASTSNCKQPMFSGFRGLFKKAKRTTGSKERITLNTNNFEKDSKKKKKKKKKKYSYKKYMKGMMKSSRYA